MKPEKTLKVCGSITKKEPLAPITSNILEHTVVAEANMPYSNYYGRVPDKPQPNSLFLFTERFYTLEEALRLTQNIDICAKNQVNTAVQFFCFTDIMCQPFVSGIFLITSICKCCRNVTTILR